MSQKLIAQLRDRLRPCTDVEQDHDRVGGMAIVAATIGGHHPAAAGVVLLIAGLAALVGTEISRWQHFPREKTREIAENWAFAGGIAGMTVYMITLMLAV